MNHCILICIFHTVPTLGFVYNLPTRREGSTWVDFARGPNKRFWGSSIVLGSLNLLGVSMPLWQPHAFLRVDDTDGWQRRPPVGLHSTYGIWLNLLSAWARSSTAATQEELQNAAGTHGPPTGTEITAPLSTMQTAECHHEQTANSS